MMSAGSSCWPRIASTEYWRKARWMSCQPPASSFRRSTPDISAPSAPASGDVCMPYYDAMKKRIAVVGAGALGGYVGGSLAHLGHDVTLIDPWPENVETIRAKGLELDGVTPEEKFVVKNAKTLHLTEVQSLA